MRPSVRSGPVLIVWLAAASLAACSKSDEPASPPVVSSGPADAAAAPAAGFELAGPSDFDERLDALLRSLAASHVLMGQALDRHGLHAGALLQYQAALRRNPDQVEARTRLGYTRGADGRWAADPKASVLREDRPGASEADGWMLGQSVERDAGQACRELTALGEAARAARLPGKAARAYRLALEYRPDDPVVRERLGFVNAGGAWLRAAERARRDEFRAALARAERTPAEGASALFVVTGGAALPEQLPLALATREMFLRLFEVPAGRELTAGPMRFEMLGSQDEWERAVEELFPEESWPYAKSRLGGRLTYGPPTRSVNRAADTDPAWRKDLTVHDAVHVLLRGYQEGTPLPVWLTEGVGYVFQMSLLGTALSYCVPGEPMLENPTWDHAPPESWRALLRASVIDGSSPGLDRVVRTDLESMTSAERIKTYSLADYLLAERRRELLDLLARLRAGEEHDAALLAAFGLERLEGLDEQWRAYVLDNY